MDDIDILAAIVAGLLGYFPGALWYSPAMFLKPWAAEMGIDLAGARSEKHSMTKTLIGIIPSVAAAIVFALILGPDPELGRALCTALAVGGGLIATSLAIQYLHEGRSLKFFAINAGFHLVQFLIFALVLGLWP